MKRLIVGFVQGLLWFVVSLAAGMGIILACDLLYRVDIRLLNIPETTGMTEQMVLDNYQGVTDYLSPLQDGELSLPTLQIGEQSAIFFRQLKVVVLGLYAAALTAAIVIICLQRARKGLGKKLWNISGAVTLTLAASIGVLSGLNFTQLQTFLCDLLFPGGSWRMYEDLDPVVTLFPSAYYLHATAFLLFIAAITGIVQICIGCSGKKGVLQEFAATEKEEQASQEEASKQKLIMKKQNKKQSTEKQVYRKKDN